MKLDEILYASAQNQGIEAVVCLIAKNLGHPLLVMDDSFHFLASSTKEHLDDEIWSDFLDGTSKNAVYPDTGYTIYFMMQVMESQKPLFTDFQGMRQKRAVGKIFNERQTLGYYVVLENHVPFTPDIEQDLQQTALILAIELNKLQDPASVSIIPAQKVLEKLLKKEQDIHAYSHAFLSSLFFCQKEESYFILSILCPNDQISFQKRQRMNQQICSGLHEAVSLYFENHLIVIFSAKSEADSGFKNAASILKSYQCPGGASLGFEEFSSFYGAYEQAMHALSYSAKKTSAFLSCFKDIYFQDLLEQLSQNVSLSLYIHPDYNRLAQMDSGKQTQLIYTLKTYLLHGGNLSQSAQALYIHRNTLIYRLDTIEKILRSDLKDSGYRLHLLLSILIAEYENAS